MAHITENNPKNQKTSKDKAAGNTGLCWYKLVDGAGSIEACTSKNYLAEKPNKDFQDITVAPIKYIPNNFQWNDKTAVKQLADSLSNIGYKGTYITSLTPIDEELNFISSTIKVTGVPRNRPEIGENINTKIAEANSSELPQKSNNGQNIG